MRPGLPVVQIVDQSVPLPAQSLDVRAEGLWAQHVCETPFEHWTIGNEAYAVAFDDPFEAAGAGRGEVVAFGIDLEWEAAADPRWTQPQGYEVAAEVYGEILVGSPPDRLPIEAAGWWRHHWGPWPPAAPAPVPGEAAGAAAAEPGVVIPLDGLDGPDGPDGGRRITVATVTPTGWQGLEVGER